MIAPRPHDRGVDRRGTETADSVVYWAINAKSVDLLCIPGLLLQEDAGSWRTVEPAGQPGGSFSNLARAESLRAHGSDLDRALTYVVLSRSRTIKAVALRKARVDAKELIFFTPSSG